MSLKKSTTTNIDQYLKDELRTTEARNFQVEMLRDADLLERVFLEKMNKKVSETQTDDEFFVSSDESQILGERAAIVEPNNEE